MGVFTFMGVKTNIHGSPHLPSPSWLHYTNIRTIQWYSKNPFLQQHIGKSTYLGSNIFTCSCWLTTAPLTWILHIQNSSPDFRIWSHTQQILTWITCSQLSFTTPLHAPAHACSSETPHNTSQNQLFRRSLHATPHRLTMLDRHTSSLHWTQKASPKASTTLLCGHISYHHTLQCLKTFGTEKCFNSALCFTHSTSLSFPSSLENTSANKTWFQFQL